MTLIPIDTSIDDDVREVFAAASNNRQPPLNLRCQVVHAPSALVAYAAIRKAVEDHGVLDHRTRFAVMLAVSAQEEVPYSVAVNSVLAARAGFEPGQIDGIVIAGTTGDAKLDALLIVARHAGRHRGGVSEHLFQQAVNAGYSKPELAEAFVSVQLASFVNHFVDYAQTPFDVPTGRRGRVMDTSMTRHKILIVFGSTRAGRAGEPVAKWLADVAAARGDLTAELVDLATLELLWMTNTPPANADREPGAEEWAQKVAGADGYVLVSSEDNHGYAAPLKNALDLLFAEWARKPVAFLSYGGAAGGVRAVEQSGQVAVHLNMVRIRGHLAIPGIFRRLDQECQLLDPPVAEAELMLDDLVSWAEALVDAREKTVGDTTVFMSADTSRTAGSSHVSR